MNCLEALLDICWSFDEALHHFGSHLSRVGTAFLHLNHHIPHHAGHHLRYHLGYGLGEYRHEKTSSDRAQNRYQN